MTLEPTDIIIFNDSTTAGYQSGVSNTLRVEDLINKLKLIPDLRTLTINVDSIQQANGTAITGGHIKITLTVEHDPTPLINT